MKIKVIVRNKTEKDFAQEEYKSIARMADIDTKRLAETCQEVIIRTIMEKSDNPTGRLASVMKVGKVQGGHGVGDIDELDSKVPWWNHVDKGSIAIGANWEHFLPKGYWAGGKWISSKDGFSGIKPKSPIAPLNYIATTLQKMEAIIPRILKG